MDWKFQFQLLPTDAVKMQPVVLGRYYRPTIVFANGLMLIFALSDMLKGENLVSAALMATTASIMLFDRWLLYTPYFAFRNTDACVKVDSQNLTSSLGEKSYEIPWGYLRQHGALIEENEYFYFKSILGNIYLPKRAFDGDDQMNRFRDEMSDVLGTAA